MTRDGAELYVLGNASIDVTFNVPRLPAPGETLMARGMVRAPGGKGLNQAVVAARAGARVRFCAPIGGEAETALVHAALAREKFADLRMIVAGQPTDLSTLIVAEGGENCIISTGDCAEGLTPYIAKTFVRPMRAQDWLLGLVLLDSLQLLWQMEQARLRASLQAWVLVACVARAFWCGWACGFWREQPVPVWHALAPLPAAVAQPRCCR